MSAVDAHVLELEAEACSIADKVSFLTRGSWAPSGSDVLVRETRTSFVFLTEGLVYKLKKPIRDPLIDFTTLSSRLANATEEVRLNRRLAPDVYLGVEPLRRLADGSFRLGGADGVAVDWLVVMRRLPDGGFLDAALASGRVQRSHIEAVADVLVRFYQRAEAVRPPASVYARSLRTQILSARRILLDPRLNLSRSRILLICGVLLSCTSEHGLAYRRARCASLVEGHGDLRPEHIWLDGPPLVIDCLEFKRELRIVDPLDELSFLALECERLGAPWVGRILLGRASDIAGHHPPEELLVFYRCFRATLRASFAMRHFLEPARRKRGGWPAQARDYLRIAERAAAALSGSRRP